jgi:hypothetical protein
MPEKKQKKTVNQSNGKKAGKKGGVSLAAGATGAVIGAAIGGVAGAVLTNKGAQKTLGGVAETVKDIADDAMKAVEETEISAGGPTNTLGSGKGKKK